MLVTIFDLTLIALLCSAGTQCFRNPEAFLTKFGRPTTEKHIRATRMIGCFAFTAAFATLLDWIYALWKSS
jgi:hypothetical protein